MRSDDEQVNEIEELRAEVERLRADNLLHCGGEAQWRARARAVESSLAAATELLRRFRNTESSAQQEVLELMLEAGAFLAAQPAAQSESEGDSNGTK